MIKSKILLYIDILLIQITNLKVTLISYLFAIKRE